MTNYVEPFYGSGAIHLMRPAWHTNTLETINDYDGYVANFWRAVKHDPEATAGWADDPVNENDLHARHVWLVGQRETLRARMEGDPDFYDAKIAGWWVWGICCWIGGHFCSGDGPWQSVDGQLVHLSGGRGVTRRLVHLGNKGMGVTRQLVHLGDKGRGVTRQLVHLGDKGMGVNRKRGLNGDIYGWFEALSARLRLVRVCSGDWARICGPTPTVKQGLTGVFLDPPYGDEAMRDDVYRIDSDTVAHDVLEWCRANGDNPLLRIALCGYEGERHHILEEMGWEMVAWKAAGGYQNLRANGDGTNNTRERIWFSPHCIRVERQLSMFADVPRK